MERADVLLIEDDAPLREALMDTLSLADFNCHTVANAENALQFLSNHPCGMVVCDVQLNDSIMDGHALLHVLHKQYPNIPVLMMTAHGSIHHAVQAMREGAVDYLIKPFSKETLVEKIEKFIQSVPVNASTMIAEDSNTKKILVSAQKVARSDATVLLTGPSGSGKEVLAHYIHDHSSRSQESFVAINCAAIPDNMLEATLFGYEKGSFTGAHQSSAGKFEQAQGGTLLLDEISEMSLSLQAKLLRVLQEKEVERLGGKKVIPLNVRVIATSNRDLQDAVRKGHFREDLYYRLNVFPIELLPLKDRRDDILPLANYLLIKNVQDTGRFAPQLSESANQLLRQYDWPGNVREMNNVLQRALILQSDDVLTDADFDFLPKCFQTETVSAGLDIEITEERVLAEDLHADLRAHEFQIILDAMQSHLGHREKVAKILGISPRTLRYKLAQMRHQGLSV